MKSRYFAIALVISISFSAEAAEPELPAIPELTAAADRGETEAQFQLARAYLYGKGVARNEEKAFEWMKSAAEKGHADAMGGMGYFYSAGLAVGQDAKLAEEWFRKGAEKGSAKARLNLSKLLLESGHPKAREEGVRWLREAADQAMPEAALTYGSSFYFGDHGLTKDPKQALPYLKVAAEAGLAGAQNLLGTLYSTGQGVSIDAVEAEGWFRKAALQGHVKAQSSLGRILNPLSAKKDVKIEALGWLLLASSQGEVTADKSLNDAAPALAAGDIAAAKVKVEELRELVIRNTPE